MSKYEVHIMRYLNNILYRNPRRLLLIPIQNYQVDREKNSISYLTDHERRNVIKMQVHDYDFVRLLRILE